jgi:hypothetical protein
VTLLERVTAVLERARVAGGWTDEDVARDVLIELGLYDPLPSGFTRVPGYERADGEPTPE